MSNTRSNISNKRQATYSFLRFAIIALILILLTGVFIVAKILMVYV
ncbi:MAG: hypothetical protein PHW82_07765 [Bacteroidales bacterium]|nr:hypothetical protein [Bacteroidales bacterium]